MADKYIDVVPGAMYLKKIFLSMGVAIDNLDITSEEIDYCETWAENQIDGKLGISFPVFPATPMVIRDLALALTAHKARDFLVIANSPNLDEHTEKLKKEAFDLIDDIIHGRFSLFLLDGTVHPKYPGPSGGDRFVEQPDYALRRYFINMHKEFYQMRQDVEDNDESGIIGVESGFNDIYYSER